MRILFSLIVFMVTATVLPMQVSAQQAKAEMKFEAESHDFGKLKRANPVKHDFVFTNTGTEPVLILEVRSSCGCSVPSFSKVPVNPGEKGKISVEFDAAAVGPFTKHLTVRSNTKTPVKTLVIRGVVEN